MSILLRTVLFGVLAASIDARHSDVDVLRFVFGDSFLKHHFSVNEVKSVQRTIENAYKHVHNKYYILCTSPEYKNEAVQELNATIGESNFHIVYNSIQNNLTCFITTKHHHHATLTHAVPLPLPLKLHPSVFHLPRDPSTLEALRGFMHHKGISSLSSTSIASTVLHNLKHNNHTHIHTFLSQVPHLTSLYHTAASALAHSSVYHNCHFHKINMTTTPKLIRIHNIHHLPHAYCVLFLGMHLAAYDISSILVTPIPHAVNDYARAITQSGLSSLHLDQNTYSIKSSATPYSDVGLDGTNQVIGIGDSGLDEYSCFFEHGDGSVVRRSPLTHPYTDPTRRKVVQYINYQDSCDKHSGHGTHVSGTVAGNCLSRHGRDDFSNYNGVAAGAKIAFFDLTPGTSEFILPPDDLYHNYYGVAATADVAIHTNSWGSPLNYYNAFAVDSDAYLYDHPEFLILFAAGNDGDAGFGSVIQPAVSKNILTVGATESGHRTAFFNDSDPDAIAFFSSIGPTFDNRIKPDIVAPGYFLYSANASNNRNAGSTPTCSVIPMAGTSMATPTVAGNAALIRQYFSGDFYESYCASVELSCKRFVPSGVLIKAMLLTSGEDVSRYSTHNRETTLQDTILGEAPDNFQGYGRVQLTHILPLANRSRYILYVNDLLPLYELSAYYYSIEVTDRKQSLRFTVSWYDPPNVLFSAKAVINDIDIIITAPSGKIYYGNNIIDDELNNNERVVIKKPEIGIYKVTIRAKVFGSDDVSCSGVGKYCQKVSIVSVSSGATRFTGEKALTYRELMYSATHMSCIENKSALTYVGMQAANIASWGGATVKIKNGEHTHELRPTSTGNMWAPASEAICLPDGRYTVALDNTSSNQQLGVSIDNCGVYLSTFKKQGAFSLHNQHCTCVGKWITVVLSAKDESWNNNYYYSISNLYRTYHRGTLAVAEIAYQRLCFPYDILTIKIAQANSSAVQNFNLEIPECGVQMTTLGSKYISVAREGCVEMKPWHHRHYNGWVIILCGLGALVLLIRLCKRSQRRNLEETRPLLAQQP